MPDSDTITTAHGRGRLHLLNVLTLAACFTAALALAFEFGFYRPPLPLGFLHACELAAALCLAVDALARFPLAASRREYLTRRWPDLLFLATLLIALALTPRYAGRLGIRSPALFLAAVQLFLAGHLFMRPIRAAILLAGARPVRVLIVSFLSLTLVGAACLKLPRAVPTQSTMDITWTDAVFTSTSAVCVTGLSVRAIGTDQIPGTPQSLRVRDLEPAGFTLFGQAVTLVLMQLGGLVIMIAGTIFAVFIGRRITNGFPCEPGRPRPGASLASSIGRIVAFILVTIFAAEAVGAVLLHTMYSGFTWPAHLKWFTAIYHSVSAFCNCGLSLTPDSLQRYHGYWQVHGVIAPLIVLGGLGFPVLLNLHEWIVTRLPLKSRAGCPCPISLHSKIVLLTTAALIVAGAAGLLTLDTAAHGPERGTRVESLQPTSSEEQLKAETAHRPDPHQLRYEPVGQGLADAFFLSVAARSTGFTTVNLSESKQSLSQGSNLLLVLLMLIGGSPASAAGGMKTVTFALLVLTAVSVLRRRPQVESFNRSLAAEVIRKAVTLAVCYCGLVALVVLCLSVTEAAGQANFMQLLFESASACGSAGLSTGLTPNLSIAGRFVIIVAMLVGRLGLLVLLLSLALRPATPKSELPAEQVTLA